MQLARTTSVASATDVMVLKGCGDYVLARATSRTSWSEQAFLKSGPVFARPGVKLLHVSLFLRPPRMVSAQNDRLQP